ARPSGESRSCSSPPARGRVPLSATGSMGTPSLPRARAGDRGLSPPRSPPGRWGIRRPIVSRRAGPGPSFAPGRSMRGIGRWGGLPSAWTRPESPRRQTKITFAHEDAIEMNWSIPEQRKLADVPVEEKIAEVQSVDRDLMALGLKIPARYFQFSDNRIVKYFANSEGSRIRSYSPRLRVFYFLTVAQDGQVEQTYRNYGWSGGWEGIAAWDLGKRVIDEARSMQRSLVEGKKSPEGKMDLVAGPQVAGIASHESCGHPTEADRVLGREASQAGKSFIPPDGIGMRVGSEVVNVVDDPTVEHAEVKHPVRNTIIELTTPAFWSAVDAVGKDLDFEAGFCGKSDPGQALDASMGGPTIRLRNVYLR